MLGECEPQECRKRPPRLTCRHVWNISLYVSALAQNLQARAAIRFRGLRGSKEARRRILVTSSFSSFAVGLKRP
jgi:hypothetical protein